MNVLKSPCLVSLAWDPNGSDPQPDPKPFEGIWDTGATGSVINQAVVDACGLSPTGMALVVGVHGQQQVETYLINIMLYNRVGFHGVTVTKGELPSGSDMLIGMNIINRGDFAVTNLNGNTMFSYRYPSMAQIDFVEANPPTQGNRAERRRANRSKR